MPTRERVNAFIATVENDEHIRAIEDFYTEDASMQENLGPPRKTRAALIAHERAVLKSVEAIRTRKVSRVLIDGDLVVINWIFDITTRDGKTRVMDELALQRWRGDRIAEEQFYYDPAAASTR